MNTNECELSGQENAGEIVLYATGDGNVRVDCLFLDESIWLTQQQIADLFDVDKSGISRHMKNIYETGELAVTATVAKIASVQIEGSRRVKRKVDYYSLDAIISVGYRVNSYQATQFRIWATRTLKEFMIKGFVLDDERLKQGNQLFGRDYFEELLERIREIRASERRFYQKIADIYALAVDYDKDAPVTREFFAAVQNKLHWAITGKTAAEIIHDSADAELPHMGLTTWKQSPHGKILMSDVTVAKNYLGEEHIRELNRIVSAYLDLAENRAERGILMKMKDWAGFLNRFLELSDYPVLPDKGSVSALEARLKAEQEYEVFREIQDVNYISDFDREVRRLKDEE
ncbi:MAG: virulence RhuM family protein [Candidatus Aegiribacteria sp.]|nr:virulence RhuM family protein [Candidatus Aegiribacteria sp.]